RFVARERNPARREGRQCCLDAPEITELRCTRVAPVEMRAHGDLVGHAELTVVKRLQAAARGGAREGLHAVRSSRSCRRSVCPARVRRDLTVPMATPSENAISS